MTESVQMIEVRVARRAVEAEGICSFEFVSTSGVPLPPFDAGAHIDVRVPGGLGLIRQYSLCNQPGERHRYLIGVLNDPSTRGGSRAMHEHLHEGDTLWIGTPRNKFPLHNSARHSILLAGGIGVTPMLAMAESLAGLGSSFELHYSCRTPARMAFGARLKEGPFSDAVSLYFDDGPQDRRLDLKALLKSPNAGTHMYVCGPAGFIDSSLAAAAANGWPSEQVHFESFSARAAVEGKEQAFDVTLKRSGRTVHVPADKTVVQALAANGIDVPVSCEQGVCGTCITPVLQGVPDHRDVYFTPAEHAKNDRFTPCCSRSKTSCLVLDL